MSPPGALVLLLGWLVLGAAPQALAVPIVVYGDERLPPYEFVEDGVAKGVYVDMWRAVGRELRRPIDYRLTDWPTAQANVSAGFGDALSGMSRTAAREATYAFSQTTVRIGFSLFVRNTDAAQFTSRPLSTLRIGVTASGLPRMYFTQHHPKAALVIVADTIEGLRRLLRGDIDAFAAPTWTGNFYLRELNVSGVTPLPQPFTSLDAAIAVARGNPELLAGIDSALTRIRADGAFDRIADKWAGERVVVFSTRELWLSGLALAASTALVALIAIAVAGRIRRQALARANHWLLKEMAQHQATQADLEKANAELAARTREAEQADRAKTRFLAGVSHELRTPLHTMLGFVRLARHDTAGEARERLAIAERSSRQLLKLIDELLEFNQGAQRMLRVNPEPASLRDILVQIERSGSLMAVEHANHYEVAPATDLPDGILADEQRLLQVLQNLVGNACKYTHGGTVRVRVERDGEAPAAAAQESCRLRFSVEDTGAGIAAEDQEHLFEPFTRGTAGHGQPGLGLGLAIAEQWVRAMGGAIRFESAPGCGSTFWFALSLPLAPPDASMPAGNAAVQAHERAAAARTVLLADDIAENRLLLRYLCERWGFAVVEAADGSEALQACLDATPPIDAAVVDQFMPNMDGWTFLQRLRALPQLRRLPVALISASTACRPPNFPPDIDFDLALGKPLDEQALESFLCERLAVDVPPQDLQPLGEAAAAGCATLRADELAHFREMVDLGRVEAIADWARDLAAADPARAAFAERIVRLCRAADLAALERLAGDLASAPGCGL